jgi:hypothetical protein
MTTSSSLWLLKYESNSSYSIMTTTSSEIESDSLTDTEGSVAVLIHTCKRELSPAHLVCPRRYNA